MGAKEKMDFSDISKNNVKNHSLTPEQVKKINEVKNELKDMKLKEIMSRVPSSKEFITQLQRSNITLFNELVEKFNEYNKNPNFNKVTLEEYLDGEIEPLYYSQNQAKISQNVIIGLTNEGKTVYFSQKGDLSFNEDIIFQGYGISWQTLSGTPIK